MLGISFNNYGINNNNKIDPLKIEDIENSNISRDLRNKSVNTKDKKFYLLKFKNQNIQIIEKIDKSKK